MRDQARAAYAALEPRDIVIRHQWLFAEHWVEESFDELEEIDVDVTRWEKKIVAWRTDALKEIWSSAGYEGVLRLCEGGNAPYVVGRFLTLGIVRSEEAAEFIERVFKGRPSKSVAIDRCISGVLDGLAEDVRENVLRRLLGDFSKKGAAGESGKLRLLLSAPFRRPTWAHVRELPDRLRYEYWKNIDPQSANHDRDELRELITSLIEVNRPRAAYSVVRLVPENVEPTVLLRLMTEVATNGAEPKGHYMLESYDIGRVFKALDSSAAISDQQMGQLEFLYLDALGGQEYGIPHLEAQLSESPAMFVQAIGLCYKRSDNGEDPPEWRPAGPTDATSALATQAFRLLQKARRLPGTRPNGTIDVDVLKSWISTVLGMCKKYAREKVGEHIVGEFLAKCPSGEDGIWPCVPMRQALEELGTREIIKGMIIGVINARGAVWCGPGGDQERDLAAKYRGWSKQLSVEYPMTSRLLEDIATHYDYDANWHDTHADVRRRLSH